MRSIGIDNKLWIYLKRVQFPSFTLKNYNYIDSIA